MMTMQASLTSSEKTKALQDHHPAIYTHLTFMLKTLHSKTRQDL